jgi:Ca2+-binding RTX toxin-like protein
VIAGGLGNDYIYGRGGDDLICGGDLDDGLYGGRGNDQISGGDWGDGLHGGRGNDQLFGDEALDYLEGGPGFDRMDGGGQFLPTVPGGDVVSYAKASAGVVVNLDMGTGGPVGQDQDHISGVFTLVGSAFDDVLVGGADHANRINGGAGNDYISGTEATHLDLLSGDEGSDHISGEGGPDHISGGPGDDILQAELSLDESSEATVDYHAAAGPVHVDLASGVATGEGTDSLVGFSNILGSPFDDVLQGDKTANTISGEAGSDSISGRGGADTLFGYDLDPDASSALDMDTVVGGTGFDLVVGGPGDDTLDVQDGAGFDTVDGVAGVDDCSYDLGDTVFFCP